MNTADDLAIDGGGSGDAFEISGGDENFNSDESIEQPANDAFKEFGLDPSKYGIGADEPEVVKEEPSQGSEEDKAAGQETDEKSVLDRINSLGLIHNEQPLQVSSVDELKNLVQMGKDYTLKTQSLSEERKAWSSEKESTEKELNAAIEEFNTQHRELAPKLQELEQWTFALNQLAEQDPDVFAEVQRAYEVVKKQFSNPVLEKQLASIRAELAETKKGLTSREDKLIVDEFKRDKDAFTATEQSMKELGVNIDWKEVEKQWAATGMPVKSVVGSLYFESLAKAQASKAKVDTVKAKVAARPTGMAGASRPGNKVPQIDKKLSHFEHAQELLKRFKT